VDYICAAQLLRRLFSVPKNRLLEQQLLFADCGSDDEALAACIEALHKRDWIDGNPYAKTWRLQGLGWSIAGRSAAELLALDIATWMSENWLDEASISELKDYQRSDKRRLKLAIEALERADAAFWNNEDETIDTSDGLQSYVRGELPPAPTSLPEALLEQSANLRSQGRRLDDHELRLQSLERRIDELSGDLKRLWRAASLVEERFPELTAEQQTTLGTLKRLSAAGVNEVAKSLVLRELLAGAPTLTELLAAVTPWLG